MRRHIIKVSKQLSTYISDDGIRRTWIDHILASSTVNQLISDINILNDVIVSDHKPVSFRVDINVNHSAIVSDHKPVSFRVDINVNHSAIVNDSDDAGSVKYIPQ